MWSHPCPGNWMGIERTVVYYDRTEHLVQELNVGTVLLSSIRLSVEVQLVSGTHEPEHVRRLPVIWS